MIPYLVLLPKEEIAAMAKLLKAGKVAEVAERLEELARDGKAVRGEAAPPPETSSAGREP